MKVKTPGGNTSWDRTTVWGILKNPAYKGHAAFGKTRTTETRQLLRPTRRTPTQLKRINTRFDIPEDEWIYIPVPPLVDDSLFDAVQDQFRHNQARNRQRKLGTVNLLAGLTVCGKCGYAYTVYNPSKRTHGYYRCGGRSKADCTNKPVRADVLESAVWAEVESLLRNPERMESEYRRRLQVPETAVGEHTGLKAEQTKLKKSMTRLIDGYAEGLIPKAEFETRVKGAKKRIEAVERQMQEFADEENMRCQLKLLIVQLADFTSRVSKRLDNADLTTKRELIKTLIKHVELDEQKVNIVFRVGPNPFVLAPEGALSQHCRIGSIPLQPPIPVSQVYAEVHTGKTLGRAQAVCWELKL
jgi:site-specific DNA recombinase